MSFILDALKKSENERQRQSGPALFEVKVAPPRSRFPVWGIVLAALLGLNAIVIVAWLLLRGAAPAAVQATAAAPASAPAVAAAPAPAPAAAPAPAQGAGPAIPPPGPAPAPAASAPRDPQLAATEGAPEGELNSEDYEPAVEPGAARTAPAAHVRTQSSGLPTRDELHSPAVASLPELRLDLLVYDANPAKRFVMINMHRLREGESLPEGVRVERITEEGAELDFRGTRFLLPHE